MGFWHVSGPIECRRPSSNQASAQSTGCQGKLFAQVAAVGKEGRDRRSCVTVMTGDGRVDLRLALTADLMWLVQCRLPRHLQRSGAGPLPSATNRRRRPAMHRRSA